MPLFTSKVMAVFASANNDPHFQLLSNHSFSLIKTAEVTVPV